jgi:hypothetical protein
MKFITLFGFILSIGTIQCATIGNQKRQLEGLPEAQMQPAKTFSVETLTPKLDKNAIRKKIRFGTYSVPGSKVFPPHAPIIEITLTFHS